MKNKTISVVTPCFNEEESIEDCYEAVRSIFDSELEDYEREHIFCDNSSSDRTVEILKQIASRDSSVKIIINSRNFGIFNNNFNGVINSTGDAVLLLMPADMQDPPDRLPEFVKLWEQGYEIVFGIRAQREEGFIMRTLRGIYYRIISRLSYVEYPPNVGDFQLVDRKVIESMKLFHDAQPFMRMMTFDCGFRSVGVPYTWKAREKGQSKNYLRHLIEQGLTGLISYSSIPMRLAFILGITMAAISILFAILNFFVLVVFPGLVPRGIPTVIVALSFLSGVQLLFLGLIGEYILVIFNQVRGRPLVIERERVNFSDMNKTS